jgi:hypothetical protein
MPEIILKYLTSHLFYLLQRFMDDIVNLIMVYVLSIQSWRQPQNKTK